MTVSDSLLFERWRQRGDAEAFAEIVSRYSGMVYATCRRVLRGAEDAQDAAQDCFVELMRASIDPSLAFGPWLHMVAVRRSLDRLRSAARRAQREADYGQEEDDILYAPETEELLAFVDEAIEALPGPLRMVIVGRFLERRTLDELGEAHSVAEATIRYRIDKGIEEIRKTLQKRGVEIEPHLLANVLGFQLTGTAPASLAVDLGKLALAGGPPHISDAGPAVPVAKAGGALSVWKVAALVAVVAVAAAATAGFMLQPSKKPAVNPDDTQTATKRYVARDRKAAPDTAEQAAPVPGRGGDAAVGAEAAKQGLTVARMPNAGKTPQSGKPSNPFNISGAITDGKGQGIAGARICAAAWDSIDTRSMRVWQGETDASGQYAVSGIELGGHEFVDVSVSAGGYQTDGRRVDAKPGTDQPDVNFTLPEGVTLNARVLDMSGAPIPAAAVVCKSALSVSGGGSTNYHIASTNEEGLFTMGFRGEGIASLLVVPQGQPEGFFPAVTVGDSKTVDLKMTAPASLSGRVVYPDGTPAAGVDLSLRARYAPDGGTPNYAKQTKSWNAAEIGTAYDRHTTTGPDGGYAFTDLPAVPDLLFGVNKMPEGDGMIGVKLFSQDAGPVEPGEHKTFDCTLPSSSEVMTIRGRLLAMHSGRPVDGMVAYENTRTHEMSVVPGDLRKGGAFELKLTVPGTYELWGRHSSNTADTGQEPRVSVPWVAGTTRTLDIRVPDPFTLSIHVVDTEGIPVQGATVSAGQGTVFPVTRTDAQGRYSWDGFAPGIEAHFTVTKEGYVTAQSQPTAGESGAVYPEETIVLRRIDEPEEPMPAPEEAQPGLEEMQPGPGEAYPQPEQAQPAMPEAAPAPYQAPSAAGEAMQAPDQAQPNPEAIPGPEGVMLMPDEEPPQEDSNRRSSRRR